VLRSRALILNKGGNNSGIYGLWFNQIKSSETESKREFLWGFQFYYKKLRSL
jgi:hypothetical protein